MKIAITGSGYAGLAAAYFLLGKGEIHLFDKGYQKSASYISTGLMHPYPGKFPKRSLYASEAVEMSLELFREIQKEHQKPFFWEKGLFRPALFPSQEKLFRKLEKYDDVTFYEKEKAKELIEGVLHPGIFISSGVQVASNVYIEAFRSYLQKRDAHLIDEEFTDPDGYDQIIYTAGSIDMGLDAIKGQMLYLKRKEGEKLPFPIAGKGHISPIEGEYEVAGSTYEREFETGEADEKADSLIQQISQFYPPIVSRKIVSKHAAIRYAQKKSYLPLIERIDEKRLYFGALGSRGLLYHAYFAKKVADLF